MLINEHLNLQAIENKIHSKIDQYLFENKKWKRKIKLTEIDIDCCPFRRSRRIVTDPCRYSQDG
jgi:septin family protein